MNSYKLNRVSVGFGIAAAISILFNTLLMILKEEFKSIHHFLVVVSGNHWVTHGIFDVVLFVGLGLLLSKKTNYQNVVNLLIVATVIATLCIILFVLLT